MNRMAALYSRAYADIYGSGGDKLTDEQVLDFANDYGYMSAKHILLLTTDEEGNAIDDAAKAEKLAKMEDIRAQLEGKTGEELETAFDTLMQENSEDTGLAAYPDGYCFTSGEMVTEFSEAAAALEPGQLSDIVESSFGYHLILREPSARTPPSCSTTPPARPITCAPSPPPCSTTTRSTAGYPTPR